MVPAGAEERSIMTDDVQARIDALKTKGEEAAEEAKKPREDTINWNQGLSEGDMIAGLLERGAMVPVGDRKELRYLMEIRDHETKDLYTVWCGSFMLEQAVIEKAPKVGSLVVVQYHGKQQSSKDASRSFNVFTVEVEEADFEYWHKIEREARASQQRKPAVTPAVQFGPDEAPF